MRASVSENRRSRWSRWAFLAAAASLLLLSRVHQGLRHDARLYFGDALARLDPQGVGRDLIFANDGQFGFSLYTPALARLVAWLGLDAAVRAVELVSLSAWLAALLFLVSRLLADLPTAWRRAAVILVLVVAPYYGAFEVFGYGEAVPTPRILVEAAAMAALATWLSGRRIAAFAILLAAMALHPIMALCGLAVLFVALCLEDRRWLIAGAAGLAVLLAAALLGAPIAERLLQPMDATWRAISAARSPAVFVTLWPSEAWGRLGIQAATLGLAATLVGGRARGLMLAALISGLLGVAAAGVADLLSLTLPLQLQLWRTQALMAVLAAAGLVVCVLKLRGRGAGGVLALCALVVGWTFIGWGPIPAIAAVAALVFMRLPETAWTRPDLTRKVAVVLSAALVLAWTLARARGLADAWSLTPAERGLQLGLVWNSGLPGWLAGATAVGLAARPDVLKPRVAIAAAVVLALIAGALWDGRTAFARWRDGGRDAGLTALLADRPGEVLWLMGGVEPWTLMGRPSWASKLQGAGVVLSRPLALRLGERIDRLRDLKLVGEDWRAPMTTPVPAPVVPSKAQVEALCAAPDAPAWIVAPLPAGQKPDPALNARLFTPPTAFPMELADRWAMALAYAAIPCAGPSARSVP